MTYFPDISVKFSDSPTVDAFGRGRVSAPTTIWEDQQTYGDNALRWENSVAGTGVVTNRTAEASVRISTGGTASGARVYRQTKVAHHYQPGKSQLVKQTFAIGPVVTNARARAGYFDARNGLFVERDGSTVSVVRRTHVSGSPVDTKVVQSSWNLDKLDGTGKSGKTLDPTKTNIFVVDLQWLGVGRVRFGWVIDGALIYCHQMVHAGVLTEVYMTTANLPLRFEVENTGTASGTLYLDHICSAVESEGGQEDPGGVTFTTSNGITTIGVTTRRPVLSVRAKATGPNSVTNVGQILLRQISLFATTNAAFYEIVLNGTLTGASFTSVDAAYSIAERDSAATAISGGIVLDSGFVAVSAGARASADESAFRKLPLSYSGLLNVQDTLSVVATSFSATSNVSAAVTWEEVI